MADAGLREWNKAEGLMRSIPVIVAAGCLLANSSSLAVNITLSTSEHQFLSGTDNQGWWATNTNNFDSNDNYFCGLSNYGHQDRSFFTFFVPPSVIGYNVTFATLSVIRGSSDDNIVEVRLFDVTTPADVLNLNTAINLSIFDDLGSGVSYGSKIVPITTTHFWDPILIPLNSQAFVAIQASAGQFFSIGARLADESQGVFGGSGSYTAQLLIEMAPVPEPASTIIGIVGLGVLTAFRPRRK
jgi:hypothetical protein